MLHLTKSFWTAPMRKHILIHGGLTVAAISAFNGAKAWLDASYAASRHPVDFMTGQTGFDASALKGYYAHMQEAGTLGIYVQTQMIDFIFILCFAMMGWMIGTFVARADHANGWGRRLGLLGGAAIVFGTFMDACENMISFIMLANPADFASAWSIIYSSFAVAKFGMITLGMALLAASLIASALGWGLWLARRATASA